MKIPMKSQENSQLRPHPNLEPLRPWPLWCSPLGLQPDRSPKFGVVFKKRKKDWNRYMDIDGYWYYWYMDTEWYNVYFCVCTDFMDIGSQLSVLWSQSIDLDYGILWIWIHIGWVGSQLQEYIYYIYSISTWILSWCYQHITNIFGWKKEFYLLVGISLQNMT